MGTLLAKIVIPKMFDFIQAPVALGEGPYKDDNIYAHYCTTCEQTFTARWGCIHALMAGRPGTVIILTARDAEDLPNIKGLRMTSG